MLYPSIWTHRRRRQREQSSGTGRGVLVRAVGAAGFVYICTAPGQHGVFLLLLRTVQSADPPRVSTSRCVGNKGRHAFLSERKAGQYAASSATMDCARTFRVLVVVRVDFVQRHDWFLGRPLHVSRDDAGSPLVS